MAEEVLALAFSSSISQQEKAMTTLAASK